MKKNKSVEVSVTVRVNIHEDGNSMVDIITPTYQKAMDVKQMAHILIGGVNLLIKGCQHNDEGIKDYELMQEIQDHLNENFISDEFADAWTNRKIVRKVDEEE